MSDIIVFILDFLILLLNLYIYVRLRASHLILLYFYFVTVALHYLGHARFLLQNQRIFWVTWVFILFMTCLRTGLLEMMTLLAGAALKFIYRDGATTHNKRTHKINEIFTSGSFRLLKFYFFADNHLLHFWQRRYSCFIFLNFSCHITFLAGFHHDLSLALLLILWAQISLYISVKLPWRSNWGISSTTHFCFSYFT